MAVQTVALDSNSRSLVAVHIACIVITTLSVALRFAARVQKRQKFGWDDGVMVIAWTNLMVYLALVIKYIFIGSAQILTVQLPPENITAIFKLAYASAIVFEVTNISVKLSMLLFYCRIFTTQLFLRQAVIGGVFCAAWFTASILVTIFQCVPIHKAWDPLIPGRCVDLESFILGYELTNIVCDLILIILPIRMIGTLKLGKRQKVLLSTIFVMGGFVTITSALRIIFLYSPKKTKDLTVNGPIWSALSVSAAVLCANLPMMKPIFSIAILPAYVRSWYSSMWSNHYSSAPASSRSKPQYNKMGGSVEAVPLTDRDAERQDVATSMKVVNAGIRGNKGTGGKDPYPLHSFNTTIDRTVNRGGDGD